MGDGAPRSLASPQQPWSSDNDADGESGTAALAQRGHDWANRPRVTGRCCVYDVCWPTLRLRVEGKFTSAGRDAYRISAVSLRPWELCVGTLPSTPSPRRVTGFYWPILAWRSSLRVRRRRCRRRRRAPRIRFGIRLLRAISCNRTATRCGWGWPLLHPAQGDRSRDGPARRLRRRTVAPH